MTTSFKIQYLGDRTGSTIRFHGYWGFRSLIPHLLEHLDFILVPNTQIHKHIRIYAYTHIRIYPSGCGIRVQVDIGGLSRRSTLSRIGRLRGGTAVLRRRWGFGGPSDGYSAAL